jgi:DNA-binding response OmpR family regulator
MKCRNRTSPSVLVVSTAVESTFVTHLRTVGLSVTRTRSAPTPRRIAAVDVVLLDVTDAPDHALATVSAVRVAARRTGIMVIGSDPGTDHSTLLDAGADDVLTTSVHPDEMIARLRALLRRVSPAPTVSRTVSSDDLTLQPKSRAIEVGGRSVPLSRTEFGLIAILLDNIGHVVSRPQILRTVWGLSADAQTNVVNMCVSSLRRKLDILGAPHTIRTIRGIGLQLQPAV